MQINFLHLLSTIATILEPLFNLEKIAFILGFVGVTLLSFNYLLGIGILIAYDIVMFFISKKKGLKFLAYLMIYYIIIGLYGIGSHL